MQPLARLKTEGRRGWRKKTASCFSEYSRLVVRFFILGRYLTQVGEVKGQIFAKPAIFQLHIIIFRELFIVATCGFPQGIPRSILNNIACESF